MKALHSTTEGLVITDWSVGEQAEQCYSSGRKNSYLKVGTDILCNAITNQCEWEDCNCNTVTSVRNTLTSAHSSQSLCFAITSKECYT